MFLDLTDENYFYVISHACRVIQIVIYMQPSHSARAVSFENCSTASLALFLPMMVVEHTAAVCEALHREQLCHRECQVKRHFDSRFQNISDSRNI